MALRSWVLFVALLLSCLVMISVKADNDGLPSREELDTKYLLTNQIVELRTQIEELTTASKTHAASLKRKDKKIRTLEKELQRSQNEKSAAIVDLEAELAEAKKTISDFNLQVSQLEQELVRIKAEYSAIVKRAELAEAKADSFELEASEKLKLVEVVKEYKIQLEKAESDLRIAKSGKLKAQKELAAKAREMAQSANAWLPPWLAIQASKMRSHMISSWAIYGAPLMESLQRLATLKAAQFRKFSKPYMRSFNKNVRPVVRSQWKKTKTIIVPQYQRIKKLVLQYLAAGKKYLSPHLSKVQESVDTYVQTVRVESRPYLEQAASFLSPHFEKANIMAEPYVKHASDHYQSVMTQASTFHEQLQDSVKGTMRKNELLSRWATKELIWYLASALLALPLFASLLVFSSVFGTKKPIKRQRRSASAGQSSTPSAIKKPRRPRSAADIKQGK